MARFIIIDRNSGYIFFDINADTALEACEAGEKSIGNHGREYAMTDKYDARASYDVYRADNVGSDVIPAVFDGQDQGIIDAVCLLCPHVATIRATDADI